jgi:hypothetical protein
MDMPAAQESTLTVNLQRSQWLSRFLSQCYVFGDLPHSSLTLTRTEQGHTVTYLLRYPQKFDADEQV